MHRCKAALLSQPPAQHRASMPSLASPTFAASPERCSTRILSYIFPRFLGYVYGDVEGRVWGRGVATPINWSLQSSPVPHASGCAAPGGARRVPLLPSAE